MEDHSALTHAQIMNLRKRLYLTKNMQMLGVGSLLLCVATMFLIYIGFHIISAYVFGLALLLLIISLTLSVLEIRISAKSLEIYLGNIEEKAKEPSNSTED
jgi:low temperature requirement protein LtrA